MEIMSLITIERKEALKMLNTLRNGLETTREQLLRQFMLSKGSERAEILTRIMDLDEQLEEERTN